MNDGGSHHFRRRQIHRRSARGDRPSQRNIACPTRWNSAALASLCEDYEMFVISDRQAIANAFHDAMSAFGATWLWHPMPRPFDDTRAILLPKDEPRSRCVANAMREAGITDLGVYLTALAAHQIENSQQFEQEVSCRP